MTTSPVEVAALHVAGERIEGGDLLEVLSPWDGRTVGVVPHLGGEAARAAIDAAASAMTEALPAHRRAEILDGAAALLRERRQLFARILADEIGKPFSQGLVEADRATQTLLFAAAEARTLAGRGIAVDAHPAGVGSSGFTIRVPIGVIGAITPFNFPLNLAAHKVGPAIAAGCGVVLKPAREAPLAAVELANVLYEAGLPTQWLSVTVGPAAEIVDEMIADDRVAMLTFTGSSEVGWGLAARAPRKRVSLELGNSTPVIICADADLDVVAADVATTGYGFAGQSCISVQRVIVDERVRQDFAERLKAAVASKRVGDPRSVETHVGPLINAEARTRVAAWVEEAIEEGAKLVAGELAVRNGCLPPVILDDPPTSAKVWREEIFGPVVVVRGFSGLDEALGLANDTEFGLQAGIYTRDMNSALTAAERLEYGGVTVNKPPTFRVDQMPYGGTKASGNTREGPYFTVREMTEERMVLIGR